MTKQEKNKQAGFTLIEIIVVVTICGIITAAIVPQFALMSERARMKTDISSVKMLQRQIDAYCMDNNVQPEENVEDMISILGEKEYLDSRYIDYPHYKLYFETMNAQVIYDKTAKHVKLKVLPASYDIFPDNHDKQEWLTSS